MAGIDWNLIRSPTGNPSDEIGTIRGMLAAFAEGRQRRMMADRELQWQQQVHADNLANQQADNERESGRIMLEHQRATDTAAFNQQKHADDILKGQMEAAGKAREPLYAALKNNDPAAEGIAQSANIGLEKRAPGPDPLGELRRVPFVGGLLDRSVPEPGPGYRVTMPDGSQSDYDPAAAREEEQRLAQEKIARETEIVNRALDPFGGRAALFGNTLAAGGNAAPTATKDGLKMALDEEAAKRRAAARAASGGRANRPMTPGEIADNERQDTAQAKVLVDDVLAKFKFTDLYSAKGKYDEMLGSLKEQNAALDAATAGTWTKLAQGGTGVISDADMAAFWHKIGGLGIKTMDVLQGVINGTITHSKREIVIQAVVKLAADANKKLRDIKTKVHKMFDKAPPRLRQNKAMFLAMFGLDDDGSPASGGAAAVNPPAFQSSGNPALDAAFTKEGF